MMVFISRNYRLDHDTGMVTLAETQKTQQLDCIYERF
jgi:hypothetical protein